MLGTFPTITEQISGRGSISRVASMTTVNPCRFPARPVKGVNDTAGSPVSTVIEALLSAVVLM
jgi:hypothetical protein